MNRFLTGYINILHLFIISYYLKSPRKNHKFDNIQTFSQGPRFFFFALKYIGIACLE